MPITSPDNPKLKTVRRLQRRRDDEVFVAEGEDLVAAADAAGWPPVARLVAAGSGLAGDEVEPELLAEVSALGSGTRAIAVFLRRWADLPFGPLCVALHGVRDPGNLGTILRSAVAFGASSVAIGPGTTDPFRPKAVRASMGAVFGIPVARWSGAAGDLPAPAVALVAHDGDALRGPLAEGTLIVGAERDGLPGVLVAECARVAHLPIAGDSLNDALEELRVRHLGRKAELPNLLRGVAELPPQERGAVGKGANEARRAVEALLDARRGELEAAELDARLATDRVDVTLPGAPSQPVGRHHLLSATRREIEDVFLGLGFRVAEGPEVELVHYNFDALNHAPTHPARGRTDTFYVSDDVVLRTHTSPMQVRAMELQPPPLYVIVPGRTYRRDSDATHTPQFHQVEGLAVDEDISLADLKGTLLAFARAIFGDERDVRLRPHFFPFTEPSVEVDVSCFNCTDGFLRSGARCPVCRGTGWLEILGSGLVDPNVFAYVRGAGYDPDRISGFAFGMGVERIAMLKHGVPDLRLLLDNDVRFLEQFG